MGGKSAKILVLQTHKYEKGEVQLTVSSILPIQSAAAKRKRK
jgi:hypothetical protein